MTSSSGHSGKPRDIAQSPFSLSTRQCGTTTVVEMAGSCTMEVSQAVGRQMLELAARQPPRMVVDMSKLDFIESLGLGGLVAGYLRAKLHGGEVRLCRPQPAIRELLEMTRLTLLFPIYDRIEDALA